MTMLNLAFALYQRGDIQEAERWYRAAHEKGSSSGLFSLAALKNQQGFTAEAEMLWAEGTAKDDGPSLFRLATLYLDSPDLAKRAQAEAWLEKAHRSGQLRATVLLGRRLAIGKYGIQHVPKGMFFRGVFSAFEVARKDRVDRRLW
jgi:TPR repeat protein